MTQAAKFYRDYWEIGIDHWRPEGETISAFERSLLAPYLSKAPKVLDFGCGDGVHVGEYVASADCEYTGLDVSEVAVSACARKGLTAQVCLPNHPLPFQPERFDLVVSFEVLEHLFAPADAVVELRRVLKKGGHFIGSVPNSVAIGNRLLTLLGYFNAGGAPSTSLDKPWLDPHIRFFTRSALWRFLEEAGFRVIGVSGPPFSLLHLPVIHRASGRLRRTVETVSGPLRVITKLWPALFAYRLYFVAQKP
jgi:SAM-dependent methyltransferase